MGATHTEPGFSRADRAMPAVAARTAARRPLLRTLLPYLMAGVVVVYEGIFIVYPIIQGIIASFTITELAGAPPRFAGLTNYVRLFTDPVMLTVLFATTFIALVSVTCALSAGLGAALLLQRPFFARGLVRCLVMLPWALPDLPVLLVFNWMLNPVFGVLNVFARWLPMVHDNLQWLNEPGLARFAVILIGTWKAYPFYALVMIAALQGISEQLYEAARVDGANSFQLFRHITLPSLLPTLALLTLLALIFSIKGFSLVYLLTGGGPDYATETLVLHIYNTAFRFYDYSYGETMGTVGLAGSSLLALVFFYLDRRRAAGGA